MWLPLLLQRPYCLTVLTRIRADSFYGWSCSSRRHQHSLAKGPPVDRRVEGVNDCPDNCLCSRDIDFSHKNPRFLSQFVSSQTGTILPRNITKLCMKKQRQLAKAIKRARHMGFMPYTHKQEEYLNDEKLF